MTGRLRDVRISADGLWSRYGFANGNPFEFEDDLSTTEGSEHADWLLLRRTMRASQRHLLLDLLVRRHLVPAIAAATGVAPDLDYVVTSNNPTRDSRLAGSGRAAMPPEWRDVTVTISREQVLRAAREMGFGPKRGPVPAHQLTI